MEKKEIKSPSRGRRMWKREQIMHNIEIKNFGKFKLLKQIARGGMAEIFLGCSGSLQSAHKFVVIKRILLAHSHDEQFNKMFQNEGKIVVNLNHRNVCSIYEFGVENKQYFICMEYISGRNLRQLAKKLKSQKKSFDPALCAYIIQCACNGLDYAHNCTDSITGNPLNIIHRDVSPQNIMLSFNGDIKVIDFGIAKIDDSEATKAGVLKGKFEYMSPEQVRGKDLDRQTDIFSLGNVLWEMLAGRKLFTGGNEMQLLKKIRECQVPDLKKINPKIPDRLIEIVNKALSVNKNLRYKTAMDMGNDLSVFLNKTYPDFTHTQFDSFIKEVYVEEILEERQNLKLYSQALSGKRASVFSKPADSAPSSSFIGYTKDLEKPEEEEEEETYSGITYSLVRPPGDSGATNRTATPSSRTEDSATDFTEHTATMSEQHTVTQTHEQPAMKPQTAPEITKKEFKDNLDNSTMCTKPLQTATSSSSQQKHEFRNIAVNTGKNPASSDLTLRYRPAKQSSARSSHTTFAARRRNYKRRLLVRKLLVAVFLFAAISCAYLFRADIQNYMINLAEEIGVSETVNAMSNKINKSEPATSNREVTAVPPSSKEKQVVSLTPSTGRTVFITTQPSGVQVYINNTAIDRLTPTSANIPSDRKFQLTLKKEGYISRTVTLSPQSIKNLLKFSLMKDHRRKRKNEVIIVR